MGDIVFIDQVFNRWLTELRALTDKPHVCAVRRVDSLLVAASVLMETELEYDNQLIRAVFEKFINQEHPRHDDAT